MQDEGGPEYDSTRPRPAWTKATHVTGERIQFGEEHTTILAPGDDGADGVGARDESHGSTCVPGSQVWPRALNPIHPKLRASSSARVQSRLRRSTVLVSPKAAGTPWKSADPLGRWASVAVVAV